MGVRIRKWVPIAGVVVAVLAVGALLASALGSQGASAASPLVGRQAPDFTLPGLDGRTESTIRLSSLRGQVVVVNFWASWCAECHTEQPALNETWQRFRDAGVVMVGVDFQDAAGDAREYVARSGITYPTVVDASSEAALAYGLRGVPETYVIDRDGRMVDHIIGPVTEDRLADRITRLLKDQPR